MLQPGTVEFNLFLSGVIAFGVNTIGYIIVVITRTHKITDLIGCGTFGIIAWATLIAATIGNGDPIQADRPLFLTIAVTFWSVRLAGFLTYRVIQTKTDKRFDGFFNEPGEPWLTGPAMFPIKLFGFWTIQAVWDFGVMLPVTIASAYKPAQPMGPWGWTGFALFMFFWAYEAIADYQKDTFKKQPGNKGEFIRTGLYKYCQFPNYFAEIATWWVMFFWAGLPAVMLDYGWIVISPLLTTWIVRFLSGVAMLAPSQKERYGNRADFQEYVARTPVLLPFMYPFYANRSPQTSVVSNAEEGGDKDGR